MTKIAELKDRGAVVAWSPLSDYADVLAMGSKVRHFLVRSLRVDGEGRCVFAEAAGSLGETLQTLNKNILEKTTTHALQRPRRGMFPSSIWLDYVPLTLASETMGFGGVLPPPPPLPPRNVTYGWRICWGR